MFCPFAPDRQAVCVLIESKQRWPLTHSFYSLTPSVVPFLSTMLEELEVESFEDLYVNACYFFSW